MARMPGDLSFRATAVTVVAFAAAMAYLEAAVVVYLQLALGLAGRRDLPAPPGERGGQPRSRSRSAGRRRRS